MAWQTRAQVKPFGVRARHRRHIRLRAPHHRHQLPGVYASLAAQQQQHRDFQYCARHQNEDFRNVCCITICWTLESCNHPARTECRNAHATTTSPSSWRTDPQNHILTTTHTICDTIAAYRHKGPIISGGAVAKVCCAVFVRLCLSNDCGASGVMKRVDAATVTVAVVARSATNVALNLPTVCRYSRALARS